MPGRRFWHVSSSLNRESIARYGLDWRRMTITTGIAAHPWPGGTYVPELEAVFLCDALDDVEFFVGFGQHPLVDVWEVDALGLPVEPAPDGWSMCREAIPAARVRLLHSDRTPERRALCSAALAFTSTSLAVDEMSALAGIEPDDSGHEDGDAPDDPNPEEPYSWWLIEGSDRYAPLRPQVDELVARIAAAEAGLSRLAAAADEGRFVARGAGAGLSSAQRALLHRIGVNIETD